MRRLAAALLLAALAGCSRNADDPADGPHSGGGSSGPHTAGTKGTGAAAADAKGATRRATGPRMTRAEIRKATEGKKPREVIAALGRPDTTSRTPDDLDDPNYAGVWSYLELCVDPATGKTQLLELRFEKGVVGKIDF